MKDKLRNMVPMELEIALGQLEASLPMMIGYEVHKAKLLKARYDALVNEGFTEVQALELCKDGI